MREILYEIPYEEKYFFIITIWINNILWNWVELFLYIFMAESENFNQINLFNQSEQNKYKEYEEFYESK